MQIRVNTEYVRDVGRRFMAESAELGEIGRTLRHAIDSLDTWAWDGRSRANAEFLLNQVRPETASLVDKLEHLGRLLQHVAQCFEDEDGAAAQTMGDLPWVDWDIAKIDFARAIDGHLDPSDVQ